MTLRQVHRKRTALYDGSYPTYSMEPLRAGASIVLLVMMLVPFGAADTYIIEPGAEFQQADGFVTIAFTERYVADQVTAGQDALVIDDLELSVTPDAPADVQVVSYNRSNVDTDAPVIAMTMTARNPTNATFRIAGLPRNTQYYTVFRDGTAVTSTANTTITWNTPVPREETRFTIRSTAEPVVEEDVSTGNEMPGWIDPRIALGGIGGLIALLLVWKLYGWWTTRTRTALRDEIDRLQTLVQTQVNAKHDYDTDEVLSKLRTARGHLADDEYDAARDAVDAVREQLQEEVDELPDRADTGI